MTINIRMSNISLKTLLQLLWPEVRTLISPVQLRLPLSLKYQKIHCALTPVMMSPIMGDGIRVCTEVSPPWLRLINLTQVSTCSCPVTTKMLMMTPSYKTLLTLMLWPMPCSMQARVKTALERSLTPFLTTRRGWLDLVKRGQSVRLMGLCSAEPMRAKRLLPWKPRPNLVRSQKVSTRRSLKFMEGERFATRHSG